MQLKTYKRNSKAKSALTSARRTGQIPAVVYKQGQVGEAILVEGAPFNLLLRDLQSGHLPTTQITLVAEDGSSRKCLVKEIQYHPTTYAVLHLDFIELVPNVAIRVKVPVECTGSADCVGVKQGGVLRQVLRHAHVSCTPENLPVSFTLPVKEMQMRQSRRMRDVEITKGVKLLDSPEEVVAVIAKR